MPYWSQRATKLASFSKPARQNFRALPNPLGRARKLFQTYLADLLLSATEFNGLFASWFNCLVSPLATFIIWATIKLPLGLVIWGFWLRHAFNPFWAFPRHFCTCLFQDLPGNCLFQDKTDQGIAFSKAGRCMPFPKLAMQLPSQGWPRNCLSKTNPFPLFSKRGPLLPKGYGCSTFLQAMPWHMERGQP